MMLEDVNWIVAFFSQVVADINNINIISVPLTEEFQLPVEKVTISKGILIFKTT